MSEINFERVNLTCHKPQLKDSHLKQVAGLITENKNLVSLNLSLNLIGDKGAKYLSTIPTLTELDLSFNKITNTGALALASSHSLLFVDVTGNYKVSGWVYEELNEMMANNQLVVEKRRVEFLKKIMLMIIDSNNQFSESLWNYFPKDVKKVILDPENFAGTGSDYHGKITNTT